MDKTGAASVMKPPFCWGILDKLGIFKLVLQGFFLYLRI